MGILLNLPSTDVTSRAQLSENRSLRSCSIRPSIFRGSVLCLNGDKEHPSSNQDAECVSFERYRGSQMIPLLLAPQLVPASQQDLDPSLIARQRLVLVTCYEPSTGEETLEKWTRATRGDMVSFYRTVRSIYRVGLREWWRQMQYIGDAKSGRLVGADQCVEFHSADAGCFLILSFLG